MAGELAVDLVTDREHILQTCAEWCEKYIGRVFWPAAGGAARRSTAEVFVQSWPPLPLDASPDYPNTSGVTVSIVSVKRWGDALGAYEDEPNTLRPGGQILVTRYGAYRIEADLTPGVAAPHGVVDAVGRLYAITSSRRPGGEGSLDADGRVMNLDNLARRCGALDLLDSERRNIIL